MGLCTLAEGPLKPWVGACTLVSASSSGLQPCTCVSACQEQPAQAEQQHHRCLLCMVLSRAVLQDEMESLMQRIDLNDNGNIEFEEFAAGMLDWKTLQVDLLLFSPSQPPALAQGQLSSASTCRPQNGRCSAAGHDWHFKVYLPGIMLHSRHEIEQQLLRVCCGVQQDKLWSRWVEVAFGKLDSNGDGYIDLDELIIRLPMLTGTDNPEAERVLAVSF